MILAQDRAEREISLLLPVNQEEIILLHCCQTRGERGRLTSSSASNRFALFLGCIVFASQTVFGKTVAKGPKAYTEQFGCLLFGTTGSVECLLEQILFEVSQDIVQINALMRQG